MTALILRIMKFSVNIAYFFYKLLPVKNKIVMISRQSNNINMDFRVLGEKLEKKYEVVYLCRTLDGKVNSTAWTRIKYGFHMFTQMYHLATSKVCILDSYSPTVSILKHKKSLTIIQIWHSIGTMKKFGYAVIDKKEGTNKSITTILEMHKNYDVVLCAGEAYREHLTWGFNCDPNIIRIATLPRVDILMDKKYENKIKKSIYKDYPVLKEKENILYCPTFREDETGFDKALKKLIKEIDYSKYNLIVKLHPLSKVELPKNNNIIIDNKYSSFDMIFVADKMISDYSCIIYEAGIKNIPLYFYNYDMKKYNGKRGLALDYSELPGYTSSNPKDLVNCLEKEYDMKYHKKFIKKYINNTKNCVNKIVDIIEEFM